MHKQIALRFLPPDENVPSDLPEELRFRPIGLAAYTAKRFDGGEFVAVWGCGGIVDGELMTSPTAAAAVKRGAAYTTKRWGECPVLLVEIKHKKTAYETSACATCSTPRTDAWCSSAVEAPNLSTPRPARKCTATPRS